MELLGSRRWGAVERERAPAVAVGVGVAEVGWLGWGEAELGRGRGAPWEAAAAVPGSELELIPAGRQQTEAHELDGNDVEATANRSLKSSWR